MAAPMSSKNMSNPSSDDESKETDLLSPNFNPLKALYSPSVQLPFPKATIFNNLREYEWVTAAENRSDGVGGGRGRGAGGRSNEADDGGQGGGRKLSSARAKKREKEQVPLGRGFRPTDDMLIDTAKKKQTTFRNVLTRMSELSSGPLAVLHRCMNERCKVHVCTRSFKGLRGICTGYLVTFDKFFNMALVDVDEVWRRPSTGQRFYHEEKLTFSKIMECSKTLVSENSTLRNESKTENTKERDWSKKEGDPSEKGPQISDRHRMSQRHPREGVVKDASAEHQLRDKRHCGKESASRVGDKQRSETRDFRRHRQKEEGEASRTKKAEKSSSEKLKISAEKDTEKSQGSRLSSDDKDEDIEDLQRRLAALQKELTSLSGDEGENVRASEVDATTEDRGAKAKQFAELYKDLNSSSDEGKERVKVKDEDEEKVEIRTKSQDAHSRASAQSTASSYHQQDSSVITKGSTEVKVQSSRSNTKETEQKCSTDANVKQGCLKIKAEQFQRRHVNQLFIRGDNVVLVSVDSVLLPK